jgi:16S rRNA (guanine527-N7)-methyltransferase
MVEQGAQDLGVILTEGQIDSLSRLISELLSWTQRVNLTSITDHRDVEVKHIVDSLILVPTLRRIIGNTGTLIDVGSGAGFPGLVLAISVPDLRVTLLEATKKKIAFLEHAIRAASVTNARTAHGRAEDLARSPIHRERYDVAAARAVGPISSLVEMLVPFVRVGGCALLMKTVHATGRELQDAQRALELLDCVVEDVVSVDLAGLLEGRTLVIVRKNAATNPLFPRRPGVPNRHPL